MNKWLILIVYFLAFTQCRKDIYEFRPYGSQQDAIVALIAQAADPNTTTEFTLTAPYANQDLYSDYGSKVFFSDAQNLFEDLNGNPVPCASCAEVKLKITEAMTKSQMIARNLTAISSASGFSETSGAMKLEATCDGKLLRLRQGRQIKINVPATNPIDLMNVYQEVVNQNQVTDWLPTGQKLFLAQWPSPISGQTVFGYEFNIGTLGWNIGFQSLGGGSNEICLNMDPKYNEENTLVFLVFDQQKASMRVPFDAIKNQFCAAGVPAGYQAKMVVFSRIGDSWRSASNPINTSDILHAISPADALDAEVIQLVKGL